MKQGINFLHIPVIDKKNFSDQWTEQYTQVRVHFEKLKIDYYLNTAYHANT